MSHRGPKGRPRTKPRNKSAAIDFGQSHELIGYISRTSHRCNCSGVTRGELAGVTMFHLQRTSSCTGARDLHHEPLILQHPHRCSQHAFYPAWGRKTPEAFRRPLLLYSELYGYFSDYQHDVEHGSSQHRPLDSRGFSFDLSQQNETQECRANGQLYLASLARILAHCSPAVLGRLQSRVRVLHRAPERRCREPRSLHSIHRGLPRVYLRPLAFHPMLCLPESATSGALPL